LKIKLDWKNDKNSPFKTNSKLTITPYAKNKNIFDLSGKIKRRLEESLYLVSLSCKINNKKEISTKFSYEKDFLDNMLKNKFTWDFDYKK
jgi:hypothetical protein